MKRADRFIQSCFVALILAPLVVGLRQEERSAGHRIWRQRTHGDFAAGTFDDGGANAYVSARGRIQAINRLDLDGDGNIDLVFANSHGHSEKLDPVIYWGNGENFDGSRCSYVPANGAYWIIPADVNGDGRIDLIVPNYQNGTYDKMDSYIYLNGGAAAGSPSDNNGWFFPPFTQRIALPAQAALHAAAADLNRDGYVDVVLAFSGGLWEYRANPYEPYQTPSRIYWGGPKGFARDRYTEIPTPAASAVAIADLNGDGWPDLVVARHESTTTTDVDSHIYWGGPDGFSAERRTPLPTRGANMVRIADVNRDGNLDVIFANGEGEHSYIYLGDGKSFSSRRRLELDTMDAYDVEVADVNRDGYPDVFFANHQDHGNPLTHSYLYLGSAQGFSNERRIEFETVGAYGAALADLNEDGFPDLVVSSYREYTSFDVPSYIYWNSANGFDPLRRTPLYTHGAAGVAVADFNGDGNPDVLFCNTTSGYRGDSQPIFIYWGNSKGRFTAERRTSLPAVDAYGIAVADLNDDGWVDLIVANSGEDRRNNQELYIYWGGPNGFSTDRRTGLMGYKPTGVRVADLDRDGYLDLIVSNSASVGDGDPGSFIYWGGPDGFSPLRRTAVLTDGSDPDAGIADLNRDGYLDLIFSGGRGDRGTVIYWDDGTRNYTKERRSFVPGSAGTSFIGVADLNKDGYLDLILPRGGPLGTAGGVSYIYWGSAKGEFSVDHRSELPTEGALRPTVADLNQDGWLDIVFPNYNSGTSRTGMSRIFWGGPDGYSDKRMLRLPTDGGTGALAYDFNHDGYLDLLLVCHRREGDPDRIGRFNDHKTNSFLYWGGPTGFQAGNRLEIPTEGAHNDYGMDLGNIYDWLHQFAYVSAPHEEPGAAPLRLSWKGQTPRGSKLLLQLRTAQKREGLTAARWLGPNGVDSYYDHSGARLRGLNGGWIQYRVVFLSPDGVTYPTLDEVDVESASEVKVTAQ